MKRITSGYYIGKFKDISFVVTRAEEKGWWYWSIDGLIVHDWHSSKRIAILAAQEYISENY